MDDSKDQTYFLFGLTQAQLARTLFPLGELTKPEVRELARSMDLAVAAKSDSQEICFVPNGDYAAFMNAYLKETGVTPEATRGRNRLQPMAARWASTQGVHHFTVGQRRGLGVATGEPLYVISTDAASQRVVVGGKDDLLRGALHRPRGELDFDRRRRMPRCAPQVKIRNKHAAAAATLWPTGDPSRVRVTFDEPQRAVTPGQGAVFYDGDLVLGGGWIE